MPPRKRKQPANPSNPSDLGVEPPEAKRTRSSKAAQPKASDPGDSAKPGRKRRAATSLKIATIGAAKVTGEGTQKATRKSGRKASSGANGGVGEGVDEAAEGAEKVVARKKSVTKKRQAAPPQEENVGWGFEDAIYEEEPVDEELDELFDDSEVENIPAVPTTSLPITLRLRVPPPKPPLPIQAPAKPSSNLQYNTKKLSGGFEKIVSVSDESEFEIEPLPPKVKMPKDLRALGSSSKVTALELEDDDEDIAVHYLKLAVEQDGAAETIILSFDVDWPVFRCHVASKLGSPLLETMRIAYRIADMPKSERNHLRNESHFEEMIGLALEWINTKMDEVREARDKAQGGKGKGKGKGKEPAGLQKLRAQLKGPVVTIIDLGEKKGKGKQSVKIESVESPAVKFARCKAEIQARCCEICGNSCAIVHVPGKGPDHRPLKEEVIELWANLADFLQSKGMASTKGDPPPQVLSRMSDARFATNSGRYTRSKDKTPPDSQPTITPTQPSSLSSSTNNTPLAPGAAPVAPNQHFCTGM
ncbi:hypothetical protein FRC10_009539, partial [Ceratobasidium sp. 414]